MSNKKSLSNYQAFTPKSIKKALFNYSLNHWSFRYALASLISAIIATSIFGLNEVTFISLIGSATLSALAWVWNYFIKAGQFEEKYILKLRDAIHQKTAQRRNKLSKELVHLKEFKGYKQLEILEKKFLTLIEMLDKKFDRQELTYKRYFGIAQEVYLSAIDNLTTIVLAHKGIHHIQAKEIQARIDLMQKKNDPTLEQEMQTLTKRIQLYHAEMVKINKLLIENEEAITQLGATTIAISNINVNDAEGKIDMENSMKQLIEITNRSHEYSIKKR